MTIRNEPIGIIELGSINIKCLIFKINDDNTSEILSTSIIESNGIHNGVIINLDKAIKSIRKSISVAEKESKILLKKINVVIEQPEFLCTKFSKDKKIDGSKIHKYDIEFLLKEAKKQVTFNDSKHTIIHIFNHNYLVDGKTFLEEPIDVYADYLSHEMTFITMPKNHIKNINQAFNECDIEIERFLSCTFSLGAKLLNYNELQLGSILIDIGYEKFSLGMFKDLALVHSITLPVGINHITKDIAKVCSLTLEESEIIKNKFDYSFENNSELFDSNEHLKDIFFKTSHYRKITKSLMLNIIKSRLDEVFEILKKQINTTKLGLTSGTNILIVGGGSYLKNLDMYFSDFFKANVKKLGKSNSSIDRKHIDENFISCLGALKIIKDGWETEALPKKGNKYNQKTGFFANFFNQD
jgi:cell division protein FtsA